MNIIPLETHDAALLPPLCGTPYDAAGRIILALTDTIGMTVLGVAIVENVVHIVIKPVPLTGALLRGIDRAMCLNAEVAGRWWSEDEASGATLTRLGFEVG